LSEQSFQGAIRETEEEMSLLISEQWLLEDEPRRSSRKDERINAYYMIGPPSNMLMESVADDPFWRKEEGNDSGD
jgi:8-oxo-dGTP pyrophosphatase MutT (NUDIX family)